MFISKNQLENSILNSNYEVSYFYKISSGNEFYQMLLDAISHVYNGNHGF